jgi:hypothetical protein
MDHLRRFKALKSGDRREWYRITNKKDDVARIDVYDAIGYDPWWDEGIAVTDFAKEVRPRRHSSMTPSAPRKPSSTAVVCLCLTCASCAVCSVMDDHLCASRDCSCRESGWACDPA